MEVLTPTSKSVQNYIGNRLMAYLYREFRDKAKPGDLTPHVPVDDLMSQFPSLTEGFMRKRLKHCADLQVCYALPMVDMFHCSIFNSLVHAGSFAIVSCVGSWWRWCNCRLSEEHSSIVLFVHLLFLSCAPVSVSNFELL